MQHRSYSREFNFDQNKTRLNKYKLQLQDAKTVQDINDVLRCADVCIKISNEELSELNDIAIKKRDQV